MRSYKFKSNVKFEHILEYYLYDLITNIYLIFCLVTNIINLISSASRF